MSDITYWTGLVSIFTVAFIVGKIIPTMSVKETAVASSFAANLDGSSHSEELSYR